MREENMKLLLSILAVSALFFSACSSTFVVSKGGKGYYLGNGSNAAYTMFCSSGDLDKILAGTQLSRDMRDNLYQVNCGPDRSSEKVRQVYASLTPDLRKELRKSFRDHGYDINYINC
jgi:hypothetical protein